MPRTKLNLTSAPEGTWMDNFKGFALRTGFSISLTRPMLEYLCAVSEDAQWDRSKFGVRCQAFPGCDYVTSRALEKRGLIVRKSPLRLLTPDELEKRIRANDSCYELTPPGRHVVELLKLTGMYLQTDVAVAREGAAIARRAGRRPRAAREG